MTATQRASSSSQNEAMRSIISPMLPLRSPTLSMRAATGVVRPLDSIACASERPSRTACVAAANAGRALARNRPADICNAVTAGMPPRSSMPVGAVQPRELIQMQLPSDCGNAGDPLAHAGAGLGPGQTIDGAAERADAAATATRAAWASIS